MSKIPGGMASLRKLIRFFEYGNLEEDGAKTTTQNKILHVQRAIFKFDHCLANYPVLGN